MKKIVIIVVILAILCVPACYLYDRFVWRRGEGSFPDNFIDNFDPEIILNNLSVLNGIESYKYNERTDPYVVKAVTTEHVNLDYKFTLIFDEISARNRNESEWTYDISWYTTNDPSFVYYFENHADYKYEYTFRIWSDSGMMMAQVLGNSHDECMNKGMNVFENLQETVNSELWKMNEYYVNKMDVAMS